MHTSSFGWKRLAPVIAVALAAALALVAGAPAATAAAKGGKKKVSVNAEGQPVAVDRGTGRVIQLAPDQARKLSESLGVMVTLSPEDLIVVQLPNGALMADLQESAQEIAVATIGPNGEPSVVCVHGAEAAEAIVQQRTKVKAPSAAGASKRKAGKETGKRTAVKAEEK